MIKQFMLGLLGLLLVSTLVSAQQHDPVLFTIEDSPVNLSEFQYIYSKTNGDKADFSRASLQEYLDLYVKFKLKVKRAKDMQLDTIPVLQRELAGYRQQLANSYLVDKEVTDRLVAEVYERTKKEIDLSHIMVMLAPNASAAEEQKALKKINNIYDLLQTSESFEEVAKQHSEDTYTKEKGGRLGYFVAMFRQGFYDMETVAYNLSEGAYSKPVRTVAGYHIIKANDIRDARGEIEVAHILVRNQKDKINASMISKLAKTKIDNVYQLLQAGQDFEEVAKLHSEDNSSKEKGGVVGPLSTNSPVDETFKDMAFSITKDGAYSAPFESSVGWHIVRRISKKEPEPEDIAKRRLLTKIQKVDKKRQAAKRFTRQQIAKDAMINRIKKDGNFKADENVYNRFVSSLDSSFLTHKWQIPDLGKDMEIFHFDNNMSYKLSDFADYAKRSSLRMRQRDFSELQSTVDEIYAGFLEESCIRYEEGQLEKKYPEFKSLMREYEEGILLFEATKLLVWDKASQDSVGLKAFHEKNRSKYMWDERAEVSIYTLQAGNEDKITDLRKYASKNDSDFVLKKLNDKTEILVVEQKTFEKGKKEQFKTMDWKAGAMTDGKLNPRNKSMSFIKIEKILPPAEKLLKDARGYVIADYQDFLEKQWLKELRNSYKVTINDSAFESMIKDQK